MKSLLTTLFALSLAACANYGNFDREGPSNLAAPSGHVLSQTKSIPHKSFAARAEASRADVYENINSSLMECGAMPARLNAFRGTTSNRDRNGACTLKSQPTGAL